MIGPQCRRHLLACTHRHIWTMTILFCYEHLSRCFSVDIGNSLARVKIIPTIVWVLTSIAHPLFHPISKNQPRQAPFFIVPSPSSTPCRIILNRNYHSCDGMLGYNAKAQAKASKPKHRENLVVGMKRRVKITGPHMPEGARLRGLPRILGCAVSRHRRDAQFRLPFSESMPARR